MGESADVVSGRYIYRRRRGVRVGTTLQAILRVQLYSISRAFAENGHAIAAQTQLRILRPGPASRLHRSADLQLRMHVLRRLRRGHPAQRMSELRRRLRTATHSTIDAVAAGSVTVEAAC